MQSKEQFWNLISRTISRAAVAALAVTILFALAVAATPAAQAQTYTVIHNSPARTDTGPVPASRSTPSATSTGQRQGTLTPPEPSLNSNAGVATGS
jgi:hypothetical protein